MGKGELKDTTIMRSEILQQLEKFSFTEDNRSENGLRFAIRYKMKKVKFGPPVDPLCPPFLYYWSDLTEIFTQYIKSKKKHFLFLKIFQLGLSFLDIYTNIYTHIYIYI